MTEPHHDHRDDVDHLDHGGPAEAVDDAPGPGAADDVETPPETGDLVVDAALRDLAAAPADDLDAQLEAGEAVHRTLRSRLDDLGG